MLLLVSLLAAAQAPPPLARGVLVARDAVSASGEFSVRAADNRVFRFRFDSKTYVEREDELIDVRRLQPGEQVEVLSDDLPGSTLRYARTIHVILPEPAKRPPTAGRYRAYRPSDDRMLAAATLTFSGAIVRLEPGRLWLHTRDAGDQAIVLRPDTRYLADGEIVDVDALRPNMRVFVRAAKNVYNQVEAYQVVWGQILRR